MRKSRPREEVTCPRLHSMWLSKAVYHRSLPYCWLPLLEMESWAISHAADNQTKQDRQEFDYHIQRRAMSEMEVIRVSRCLTLDNFLWDYSSHLRDRLKTQQSRALCCLHRWQLSHPSVIKLRKKCHWPDTWPTPTSSLGACRQITGNIQRINYCRTLAALKWLAAYITFPLCYLPSLSPSFFISHFVNLSFSPSLFLIFSQSWQHN